jgi:predicted DNA-binding transcriptional regulator YafY
MSDGWSAEHQHLVLSRVARHHALIEHLRARSPRTTTAAELADLLGVAVRTVERDIARLRSAGLPIAVVRGPGGGYHIDSRRRADPLDLTPGEVAALVATITALGPTASATARSAMDKLLAAIAVPAVARTEAPDAPVR